MKKVCVISVAMTLLLTSSALANPSAGFGEYFFSVYWFVKTAPVNYTVDLIALFVALWTTGQTITVAWRLVPLYNVMVFIAGYACDYGARYALDMSAFHIPTGREQIVGVLAGDLYTRPLMDPSTAIGFMALATGLIFAANLLIISVILRWNNTDSYSRLPLAAAITALLTAPYISIRGEASSGVMLVPLVMVSLGGLAYFALRYLFILRRKPAAKRERFPRY